jgi:hypothetical protein
MVKPLECTLSSSHRVRSPQGLRHAHKETMNLCTIPLDPVPGFWDLLAWGWHWPLHLGSEADCLWQRGWAWVIYAFLFFLFFLVVVARQALY